MLDTPLNIEDLEEKTPLVISEFDAKAGKSVRASWSGEWSNR